MTKSVTKIQDKDTGKRVSVVRSTADPTKYGIVMLNPDGTKVRAGGDIVGPDGGVQDGEIPLFDGTTGKKLKGSGIKPEDKQDKLTPGENIEINNNVISADNVFIIKESDVTVSTDPTKGVSPYSTSYGYTNIDINANAGIKWIEGAIYTFVIDTTMVVQSAYRNVRVKIGNGSYIPVMGTSSILTGSSYFTKANIRQYQYSTKYQSGGALHLFTDSNTTYSSMTTAEIDAGTGTSARSITPANLKYAIQKWDGNVISDVAYGSGWDGDTTHAPSKNAVYDEIETVKGSIPSVVDNVTSTSTGSALSANQGRILNGRIDDLMAQGKFLSLWNCSTGLPISFPLDIPYTYSTGDYFMVEVVSSADPVVNYRPNGSSYNGTASSVVESDEVEVGDYYVYDGSVWLLASNHGKTVSFDNIAGDALDNVSLAGYLNTKTFFLASSSDLANAQSAYNWASSGKNAIIIYNSRTYVLERINVGNYVFRSVNAITSATGNHSELTNYTLTLLVSGSTVQTILDSDVTLNLLTTNINYGTPYSPIWDGSPATKKYVDDKSTVVSASAPANPTEGMLWYDTTNNVLKSYDGSEWHEAGGSGGGIQLAPNSEYNIKYHWYGDEDTYKNNISQYYTDEEGDTAYFTIEG